MHSRHVFIGGRWNGFSSSNTLPRSLFFFHARNLASWPSPPCVETNFKVGPIPSSRGNPLGNRADRSSKSGWRRYVTDGARARAWPREILRVTSIETERNDGWRRYALSLVKNDIALVREQWKSGKCNWNERNDEFRIDFYDLSAIGNLCGKIGARKLEEQEKKFSGGSNRCGHIPPGRREVRCASFGRNSTLGVGSRVRFIKIRPRVKEQAFRVPFLLPRLRSIKFYFGKIVS